MGVFGMAQIALMVFTPLLLPPLSSLLSPLPPALVRAGQKVVTDVKTSSPHGRVDPLRNTVRKCVCVCVCVLFLTCLVCVCEACNTLMAY